MELEAEKKGITVTFRSGAFNSFSAYIEVISILLMWFKAFYYLRIWDATNYLARMCIEVVRDMMTFCLIFTIFHIAFGEAFLYISSANPEYSLVKDFVDSFHYSWQAGHGDIDY